MATDDREIFVETQYPAPPFVDGIVRVASSEEPKNSDWVTAVDVNAGVVLEEGTGEDELAQVPSPIAVIEQVAVPARGGGMEVNAILTIQEVPYVEDYEIRVVMR